MGWDKILRVILVLESETGVLMSPERLNFRINTKAVEFLRSLFSWLLQKQLLSMMPLSSYSAYFRRTRILDATTSQVSD
ncbi:hypothetical protein P4K82_24585 [Bacillus cereus]|nr:hypothetical protein [Bacillus cereus]